MRQRRPATVRAHELNALGQHHRHSQKGLAAKNGVLLHTGGGGGGEVLLLLEQREPAHFERIVADWQTGRPKAGEDGAVGVEGGRATSQVAGGEAGWGRSSWVMGRDAPAAATSVPLPVVCTRRPSAQGQAAPA
eukprot:scaffold2293_cov92-Isochrysis_galbana.AAC.1